MDIEDRIERRRDGPDQQSLIRTYRALSPVAHVDDPSGSGPVLERLLDHLEPVFDGQLPPNAYVHGPFGSGKSAVVTALFDQLERHAAAKQSVIYTSTRKPPASAPQFAYVDVQGVKSEFAFYHKVLDQLVDETVPRHGVSTDELREQLHEHLDSRTVGAVVAVDHVGHPGTIGPDYLLDLFAGLPSKVSWLAVGRNDPAVTPLTDYTGTTVRIESYGRKALVDVLMARASEALTRQALGHEQARRIAAWADGNAHHALAALLVAADRAATENQTHLTDDDIATALNTVPEDAVSLGTVLALPANKQAVLRELLELSRDERGSVSETAAGIVGAVGLSAGTVKRFLYELAEIGVIERVRLDHDGKGRPPSKVELRFPTAAFRRLYDLQDTA